MYSVNQIREAFLQFFAKRGHQIVPSSALVPHNDPTLLFTNAGMVQFKDVFTQSEKRDYNTATTSQKCVRAGGKHNDLDNVGYTARHHTFFEMLGNFSFGDYFKEEAIKYSWDFLTDTIGLPADKLLVTVYHTDDVAFDIWKKVSGFPDHKIIRIPTNDNFWAMGDVGPCGPCSEIFYDHGEDIAGGPPGSADQDGDRFIEIWNLVFMQYEQVSKNERIDLPSPSIDTGMGLERIAAVLQNVHNNYDIDLFQSLISSAEQIIGIDRKSNISSYRVIADHLRSISFLLADGVMPSNEGRGYVLRRIMRRAMRHARQIGTKDAVIHKMVPSLVSEMGEAYPQLGQAQALITEIIKLEEQRFGETLDRGLKLLNEETNNLSEGNALPGRSAFKLYDTYGFPFDLTTDILRTRGISVDKNGFDEAMQEQKERAKAAWKGSGEQATDILWYEIKEQHGATEFLGYELEEASAQVVAIVKDAQKIEHAKEGDEVSIILNQTPFYAESGGQQGDTGVIYGSDLELNICDTAKYLGALHVHVGKIDKGAIAVGDTVQAKINMDRRNSLRNNHSATHILHAVLRKLLGSHVTQKGSLVAADRLRFDISHPKAVTKGELITIENEVNRIIRQNSAVQTSLMTPDEAIEQGAMALFGEKYGDEVRVVNMGLGDSKPDLNLHDPYSIELCGGTHVKNTGDIGFFKIISESAIAAGIRRIEAITGAEALSYTQQSESLLATIASLLKSSVDDVEKRVEELLIDKKRLTKEIAQARKQAALGGDGSADSSSQSQEIKGVQFIGKCVEGIAAGDLRSLVTDLQKKLDSGVVAICSNCDGKGALIVSVSSDLVAHIDAVELVKKGGTALGAKGGGGKTHFAQTGGPDGGKAQVAIDEVKKSLESLL